MLIGGDLQNALDKASGFGCVERGLRPEYLLNFLSRFIGMTDFFMWPPCPRYKTIYLRKVSNSAWLSGSILAKIYPPFGFEL